MNGQLSRTKIIESPSIQLTDKMREMMSSYPDFLIGDSKILKLKTSLKGSFTTNMFLKTVSRKKETNTSKGKKKMKNCCTRGEPSGTHVCTYKVKDEER